MNLISDEWANPIHVIILTDLRLNEQILCHFSSYSWKNWKQTHLSVYNGARKTSCAILVCDLLPQQQARLKAVEDNITGR